MRHLTYVLLTTTALSSGATAVRAQSPDNLAARMDAIEKVVADLRKENATLRARLAEQQSAPATSMAAAPAAQVQPAVAPASARAAALNTGTRPVYKALPMPVATASWTGFYLGGNVGLSVGRNPSRHTETFINPNPAFNDASANTFTLAPFGVIGGAQVGYNWQAAPNWVLGIEADFQGSGQSDTACVFQCTFPAIAGFDRHETITQRLDWFGTVRGRVGWTNGPVLFYGTGGLAYGQVRLDQSWSEFNFGAGLTAAATTTQMKSGWTAGAGAEAQLFGNWTAKLEYLYVDLGSVTGATFVFPAVGNVLIAERHDFSTVFRDHVVRLGLNYKFGDPVYVGPAPAAGMVYKAPPAAGYDWTGFYVGANVGLSVARNPMSTPFNTINNTTGVVGSVFFAENFTLSPWGAIGGGQIGYNWQVAPNWVLGLEADFQGSGQKDSACVICRTPEFAAINGAFGSSFAQRLDWFGTVRARVGWGNAGYLFYATGGLAYGHINTDETLFTIPFQTPLTTAASFAQTKAGWTAGTGVEARLWGNWTGKIEYLYMDFGSVGGNLIAPTLVVPLNVNPNSVNLSENRGFNSSIHDHIVRIGVNYRFGPGVVTAY